MIMKIETFHLSHVSLLDFFTGVGFGIGPLPFPLLCLTIQGTIFLITNLG